MSEDSNSSMKNEKKSENQSDSKVENSKPVTQLTKSSSLSVIKPQFIVRKKKMVGAKLALQNEENQKKPAVSLFIKGKFDLLILPS